MPIAWQPSRWQDWSMSEDGKKTDRKIVEVVVFNYLIC